MHLCLKATKSAGNLGKYNFHLSSDLDYKTSSQPFTDVFSLLCVLCRFRSW